MHPTVDIYPDRASRHFLHWPQHPLVIELCLSIPHDMACHIYQIGLRLPPAERLIWLNDIAIAVMSDVPLHTIRVWMVFVANTEPLWEREE